eukprot:CAMPEP_0201517954 /NCGR_PEP_ID=MMETSP0161_2-20130828/8923_1 /ASSEMBLY_ACC=CAM_ASM_000251 /TAXON_ID=180227 /ORGANISM="Neoparamoeba aestuarina, Strain SoJaBio B1-5/56/2" /LENGTH=130 /DNA_ID=CAMNT_0047915593 /DNA_START=119 /DNA_END=508 /DNA_ORIENTATION=-
MSGKHCGEGWKRDNLKEYVMAGSAHFAALSLCLAKNGKRYKIGEGKLDEDGENERGWKFGLGVATGSDPEEYNLPGTSVKTHILGPDLATEVIKTWCPQILDCFGIMIGFDWRLHKGEEGVGDEGEGAEG